MIQRLSIALVLGSAVACSSSSTGSPSGTQPDATGGSDGGPAAVLVVGTLASADLAKAQADHDGAEKKEKSDAESLGETRHTVMLGTSLLGTSADQFFGLDQWTNETNAAAYYGGDSVRASFSELFHAAPTVTTYVPATSWAGYGTTDSADKADPYFWVVVRGTMKYDDLAKDQAIHDGILKQFSPYAREAGDVGHVVFTGQGDKKLYFSIDVWPASDKLASFYSNPQFAEAIANLFEGPPTLGIYQSSHWFQW